MVEGIYRAVESSAQAKEWLYRMVLARDHAVDFAKGERDVKKFNKRLAACPWNTHQEILILDLALLTSVRCTKPISAA